MSSTSFSASYTSELACTQSACCFPEPELIGTLVRLSQPSHTWLLMYHSHTTSPSVSISSTASTYRPSSSSQLVRPSSVASSQLSLYAARAKRVPVLARASKVESSNWWWRRCVAWLTPLVKRSSPAASYAEICDAPPAMPMS